MFQARIAKGISILTTDFHLRQNMFTLPEFQYLFEKLTHLSKFSE